MTVVLGSIILSVLSLLSLYCLSRKCMLGWLLTIAAQLLWLPYDIVTRQYGFIILTPVTVVIALNGIRNFNKEKSQQEGS